MSCLKTNDQSTLKLKLHSLLSPYSTVEELTNYLQLGYELKVKPYEMGLEKLLERFQDDVPKYNLVESLKKYLEDTLLLDMNTLFSIIYRVRESDPLIVKGILRRYDLLPIAEDKFKSVYDPHLTISENEKLYLQELAKVVAEVLKEAEKPAYVTDEFVGYASYLYLKENFTPTIEVNNKLELVSVTLR